MMAQRVSTLILKYSTVLLPSIGPFQGSTMSSVAECKAAINAERQLYHFVVGGSILFTTVSMILYVFLLKDRLEGAPTLAAQFYILLGVIKAVFAVFIWVWFLPKCPDGCDCELMQLYVLYPIAALLVAFRLMYAGRVKLQMSRRIGGENDDKDGPIFDSVSTVEMS